MLHSSTPFSARSIRSADYISVEPPTVVDDRRVLKSSRRGFTLVELLICIAIIAVLAALLIPALNLLRDRQAIVQARQDMAVLASAMEQYLVDYDVLIETSEHSFMRTPYKFLHRNPRKAGRTPYVAPEGRRLARWTSETGEDWEPATPSTADFQIDPWGNPYMLRIENEALRAGIEVTTRIHIFTTTGDRASTAVGRILNTSRSMEWELRSGHNALPEDVLIQLGQ